MAYWIHAYLIIRETSARPVPLHGRRSTAHRMVVPREGTARAQRSQEWGDPKLDRDLHVHGD